MQLMTPLSESCSQKKPQVIFKMWFELFPFRRYIRNTFGELVLVFVISNKNRKAPKTEMIQKQENNPESGEDDYPITT